MKKKIFYIGFYAPEVDISNRICNVAAIRKMDYTMNVLADAGYDVNVISLSWSIHSFSFQRSSRILLDKDICLYMPPAFFLKGAFFLKINILITKIWFLLKCNQLIASKSVVIVYHSPIFFDVIEVLKKIKDIKIALEIGEIYSDVWAASKNEISKEEKMLAISDYFIPASKQLHIQLGNRSRFLMHGSYYVQHRAQFDKEKSKVIHIIYAGSIDETKSGATTAVDIMWHLPDNYKMHIAGYGSAIQVKLLNQKIQELNDYKGVEVIKFHGTLGLSELSALMSRCDVAVNPQNPGDYMKTAFPSKILVYLGFQLNVVSTFIESVAESDLAPLITFVNGNSAAEFASVIQKLEWQHVTDIPKTLNRLHEQTKLNFIKLIES